MREQGAGQRGGRAAGRTDKRKPDDAPKRVPGGVPFPTAGGYGTRVKSTPVTSCELPTRMPLTTPS